MIGHLWCVARMTAGGEIGANDVEEDLYQRRLTGAVRLRQFVNLPRRTLDRYLFEGMDGPTAPDTPLVNVVHGRSRTCGHEPLPFLRAAARTSRQSYTSISHKVGTTVAFSTISRRRFASITLGRSTV